MLGAGILAGATGFVIAAALAVIVRRVLAWVNKPMSSTEVGEWPHTSARRRHKIYDQTTTWGSGEGGGEVPRLP